MERPYDIHLKLHSKKLEEHLDKKFGDDRRLRKGISNYIEMLALIGLEVLEAENAA